MIDRNTMLSAAPAAVAVLLIAGHFLGLGPSKVASEEAKPRPKSELVSRPDLDDEKREAWRNKFTASIGDVGDGRDRKQFRQRMRTLGTTPVEIPNGNDDHGGLFVAKAAGDLERFLAEGGHYSGPLPPHLIKPKVDDR